MAGKFDFAYYSALQNFCLNESFLNLKSIYREYEEETELNLDGMIFNFGVGQVACPIVELLFALG